MYRVYPLKATEDWWVIMEDINKWRYLSCSWMEASILLRYQFSSSWSRDSTQSQTIVQDFFFADINKLILKYVWKDKETRVDKTVLKKNKGGQLTLPNFKTCYKATIIKIVWYWGKDRYTDQGDIIEVQKLILHISIVNFW